MTLSTTDCARCLLDARTHYLATTWLVERTDGGQFRFTDHDTPLVCDDGESYSPVDGMGMSALRKEGGLEDQGRDVHAILSSSKIKTDDLRAGKYREAKITERLVDWRFPSVGDLGMSVYWIVTTEFDGDELRAQVSGIESRLRVEAGQTYGLECQWEFGAAYGESYAGCKVNPATFTMYNALVAYPITGCERRKFHSYTNLVGDFLADDYFVLGKITWVSGSNMGLVSGVRVHTVTDFNDWDIELADELPYDIQDYDQFHIEAGCNKLHGLTDAVGHCVNKMDGFAYFGGCPYLTGTDKMSQVPLT
ncbi:MAG: DUF2163 domain-containing protein [bacterium]|nr:DUF2163 domain-containing protein [bacterium]